MSTQRRFVRRRKALGLTQAAVAESVDMTIRSVQKWEAGEFMPKLDPVQWATLCRLLECTPDELAEDFVELVGQAS